MPAIILMLIQTLGPQVMSALGSAVSNLISAHAGGDAAAIAAAITGVAAASADAIALNTLIGVCNTEKREPTQAELAPFAAHLAAAITKLQTDLAA